MTIAITGGTGFVGSAVCDLAEERGEEMRLLTRRIPEEKRGGFTIIQGDLDNQQALAEWASGASAIIHIAGLTNSPDPARFHAANVAGTENVIAAARAAKVKRFVFVSSLSAREPTLSAYGKSKAEAEVLVKQSGLDWTIVRPPGVYGPRDVDYYEMFRSAKWGFIPLPPRGASSLIHVTDLAALLLSLVDAQPALVRGKIFEPDDGREGGWGHKELADAIGTAVGRRVFAPHLPKWALDLGAKVDGALRGEKARLTADRASYMAHPNWVVSFAQRVPLAVWKPEIETREGLRETAEWYRKMRWL